MKRPAAVLASGAKKARQTSSPFVYTLPPSSPPTSPMTKACKKALAASDAVAQTIKTIPTGQTRSKMEVFRAALTLMEKGDEAISTGTRTVLGGHLKQFVKIRAKGWHRVVSSDGDLWEGAAASTQLRLLQAEGARPKPSESIQTWAKRVRAPLVGIYKAAKGRCCTSSTDACINEWPPLYVEPISGQPSLSERLALSGGKLFHRSGKPIPAAPPFRCDSSRKTCRLPKSTLHSIAPRLVKSLSPAAFEKLNSAGALCLPKVLVPQECAGLLQYATDSQFVDSVRLSGEGGNCGRYEFCSGSLPPLLEGLRGALYARLVELKPELGAKYGHTLADLEKACRAAGQKRMANIFLSYGEGGINLAHQDPYGTYFFPYQAMVMLSRRGVDFRGGEFFVKNLSAGIATEIAAAEGDVTLFVANTVDGIEFKHGVREVRRGQVERCERFSVGLVFNLRK